MADVLLAAIVLLSGFGKRTAPEATHGYIASAGLPAPLFSYVTAIVVEVGGGLLQLIGYRARIAAAVLAVFCIVSGLIFHHAVGDQNQFVPHGYISGCP